MRGRRGRHPALRHPPGLLRPLGPLRPLARRYAHTPIRRHALTAPNDRPRARYRCTTSDNNTGGAIARIVFTAAKLNRIPCVSREAKMNAGIVTAFWVVVAEANNASFQQNANTM